MENSCKRTGTALENFGIRDSSVRHVTLNRGRAVEIWSGTRTAADGFVVPETIVSEREIIHAPLRVGARAERRQAHVGDSLRRQDVPTHDGGVFRR